MEVFSFTATEKAKAAIKLKDSENPIKEWGLENIRRLHELIDKHLFNGFFKAKALRIDIALVDSLIKFDGCKGTSNNVNDEDGKEVNRISLDEDLKQSELLDTLAHEMLHSFLKFSRYEEATLPTEEEYDSDATEDENDDWATDKAAVEAGETDEGHNCFFVRLMKLMNKIFLLTIELDC